MLLSRRSIPKLTPRKKIRSVRMILMMKKEKWVRETNQRNNP